MERKVSIVFGGVSNQQLISSSPPERTVEQRTVSRPAHVGCLTLRQQMLPKMRGADGLEPAERWGRSLPCVSERARSVDG